MAGVSEATVSYTLSGKKPISAATQQRVRTAMRQLGDRPHLLAAALAGGASPIIALLFPTQERGISNSDLEYVLGAASAARDVGHHLLLWPTADRDIDEVASLHASGLVAGVILMEVRLEDERIEPLREAGVPIALIGRTAEPAPQIPFADRDFAGAAELAVAHLAGLGHRRVCLLSAPERLNELGFGATIRTEAGFAAACEAHGPGRGDGGVRCPPADRPDRRGAGPRRRPPLGRRAGRPRQHRGLAGTGLTRRTSPSRSVRLYSEPIAGP